MVELSFQGIVPPPFKRGAYTLSKRNLSRCGGARRPPRPPARVPSYLEEGSGWEGLKCPPCLRTCVHHVSELNSAIARNPRYDQVLSHQPAKRAAAIGIISMMIKSRITKSCRPLRGLDVRLRRIPGVPLRLHPRLYAVARSAGSNRSV